MGQIFLKTVFAPKHVPHTANLSFSGLLKHFRKKLSKKTSLYGLKSVYLRKKLQITMNVNITK